VAQIDSQTTFLRLIGIENFVITSSSTSETAALDVALVLDSSNSMAFATTRLDYTSQGLQEPCYLEQGGGPGKACGAAALPASEADNPVVFPDGTSRQLPTECSYYPTVGGGYEFRSGAENYDYGRCCNDPSEDSLLHQTDTGEWIIYTDLNNNGAYDGGEAGLHNNGRDGNYSDLVCQPFKQVRDAARNFIQRLDFVRGDRVGIVTYDRNARVIYPNEGPVAQADVTASTAPPMINSEAAAVDTLNRFVGIYVQPGGNNRACPIYGAATEFIFSTDFANNPIDPTDMNRRPFDSYELVTQCETNTNVGDGIRTANFILTNPATIRRDAVWVAIVLSDGLANASLSLAPDKADGEFSWPASEIQGQTDIVNYGDFGFCPWYTFCWYRPPSDPYYDAFYLDANSNNIVDGTELFAYWPDHPMGDASPPTGNFAYHPNTTPDDGDDYEFLPGYAECHLSIANNLSNASNPNGVTFERIRDMAACNDVNPQTRHYCLEWAEIDYEDYTDVQAQVNLPTSGCGEQGAYDADDYARDMADLAGLLVVNETTDIPGNFIAMFSIGFRFADAPEEEMTAKEKETAGSLLHYIADAGDNGFIDRNYEQQWRNNRGFSSGDLGEQDPCFDEYAARDFKAQCGQYYYADSLESLDAVFESIAGRLFTRIAR